MYDVIFISYKEPNAEENWKIVKSKKEYAKRVHGVKGIHRAHLAAARLASTDMFYVVDGDAKLLDDFDFTFEIPNNDWAAKKTVHVWRSKNPVNDLVYGYGGVKLLPRNLTLKMDLSNSDMTTSISDFFKPVQVLSNITAFNTDPFNTWKSAFRECAKLSSQIISRQKSKETLERLEIWCTVGKDREFGEYAIAGANAGRLFGETANENISMINNFDYLETQFNDIYGIN